MVEPGRTVGEPGVDPVPCLGLGRAVVAGVGNGSDRGLGPALRLGKPEFRAVLGWPTVDAVHPRWFRQTHDAAGADPADHLDGQVAQDPGQAGDVVAGIADDHNVRAPGLPLARGDKPLNDSSKLVSGDRGRIVRRAKPDRVQDRGPGPGARLQQDDEGVGPAWNELRRRLRTAVDVAEQPLR